MVQNQKMIKIIRIHPLGTVNAEWVTSLTCYVTIQLIRVHPFVTMNAKRIRYNLDQCGGNTDCTTTLKVTERCTSRQRHYLRGEGAFFLDTKENVGQALRSDIITVTLCRCSAAALLSRWTMDVFLWLCEFNCCHYKLCSHFSVISLLLSSRSICHKQ